MNGTTTATASNAEYAKDAEYDNDGPRVNGNVKVLPFSAIFAPSALRAFRRGRRPRADARRFVRWPARRRYA